MTGSVILYEVDQGRIIGVGFCRYDMTTAEMDSLSKGRKYIS